MADLKTLMEDIARAIRLKTGSNDRINAQDFPQKIKEINASLGEDIKYKSIVYNADNTVTLIESDDTVHIMTCEYDGDRIIGFTYDDKEIKLSFDGDQLVKVDNMDIDVSKAPVTSGGASDVNNNINAKILVAPKLNAIAKIEANSKVTIKTGG